MSGHPLQTDSTRKRGSGGTPQDQDRRPPTSRRMEEAYEDIRIFEEWLHTSHHTVTRSRLMCKGILGSIWIGIAWNLLRSVHQLSLEAPEERTVWRFFVHVIPAQIGALALCCFYGSGAHDLRVRWAGMRLEKLNQALSIFHISYCSSTGRLRIRN